MVRSRTAQLLLLAACYPLHVNQSFSREHEPDSRLDPQLHAGSQTGSPKGEASIRELYSAIEAARLAALQAAVASLKEKNREMLAPVLVHMEMEMKKAIPALVYNP
eukprot:jgi/Mesvir1/20491/Mv12378-RA.1